MTVDAARHLAVAALEQRRGDILASGYRVITEITFCFQSGIEPPSWLREAFVARFATVDQFTARSFDDPQAFGPTPAPVGQKLQALRARRLWGVLIDAAMGSAEFPRTLAGRQRLAAFLGTTEPVVRALAPPLRQNRRKTGQPSAEAIAAANPFGIARQSTKRKLSRALRR